MTGTDGVEEVSRRHITYEMHDYFKTHIEGLRHQLLSGTYPPQPVRGVKLPKPGGGERQLGGLQSDGCLTIAPESIVRLKDKIRLKTKRNRGRSFEQVIKELNQTLRGWIEYFKLSQARSPLKDLDGWTRRKLRCYRLKQRKKGCSIVYWLMGLGVNEQDARKIGSSGKGWWRLALTPALHCALNQEWFKAQGLFSLVMGWELRRVNV